MILSWLYLILFEKYSLWQCNFQLQFSKLVSNQRLIFLKKISQEKHIWEAKVLTKNKNGQTFVVMLTKFSAKAQHYIFCQIFSYLSTPILNLLSWESSCADSNSNQFFLNNLSKGNFFVKFSLPIRFEKFKGNYSLVKSVLQQPCTVFTTTNSEIFNLVRLPDISDQMNHFGS